MEMKRAEQFEMKMLWSSMNWLKHCFIGLVHRNQFENRWPQSAEAV